ncbi:MAG: hypothetical protein IT462_09990 [Planctomycetes bacterium]|nr:hypothetical protein [Planctomycetota bacterium]
MKIAAVCLAAAMMTLGGCNRSASTDATAENLAALEDRIETSEKAQTRMDKDLADLRADLKKAGDANLRLESEIRTLREAAPVGMSPEDVRAEVRKEVAAATPKTAPKVDEPKKPEVVETPKPLPGAGETGAEIARKLELAKADMSIRENMRAAIDALGQADKQTRADFVAELKKQVAEKPDDKFLRLGLATAMTTQFEDVGPGMEQGKLAYAIAEHADKAIELDKDYYDAVHFIAIFHSHYPPGFPEFKKAGKELDRAIELQAKLVWEETFTEIYGAYGRWLAAQDKKEEALAKVQAGLDKSPRNETLLAQKKELEK